ADFDTMHETCCSKGYAVWCSQTPPTPTQTVIHDQYFTNVKDVKVPHTVTVPIPPPPRKVITHTVHVHTHAFDCDGDASGDMSMWSSEKKRYCCYLRGITCHTKVTYRPHYHTITHIKHVTVPVHVPIPAPPPQVINHVVNDPIHDPPQVIKVPVPGQPTYVPKYVHQKHYVPVREPSPPQYHNVPVPVPIKDPGQVIKVPVPLPPQTVVKNKVIYKTRHVKVQHIYDCKAGFNNWNSGWSSAKKSWCCSHESRGCPGDHSGSLTKTYVTHVTEGRPHTVYHTHHYVTHHVSHEYVPTHVVHHWGGSGHFGGDSYGSGSGATTVVHHYSGSGSSGSSGSWGGSSGGSSHSFGGSGSFSGSHSIGGSGSFSHSFSMSSSSDGGHARRLQEIENGEVDGGDSTIEGGDSTIEGGDSSIGGEAIEGGDSTIEGGDSTVEGEAIEGGDSTIEGGEGTIGGEARPLRVETVALEVRPLVGEMLAKVSLSEVVTAQLEVGSLMETMDIRHMLEMAAVPPLMVATVASEANLLKMAAVLEVRRLAMAAAALEEGTFVSMTYPHDAWVNGHYGHYDHSGSWIEVHHVGGHYHVHGHYHPVDATHYATEHAVAAVHPEHVIEKNFYEVRTKTHVIHDPVTIPGKVIHKQVTLPAKAVYNCMEGFHDWHHLWTEDQQKYCCYKVSRGCTTKIVKHLRYHTVVQNHNIPVPVPKPVPVHLPPPPPQVIKVPVHLPPPPRQVVKVPYPVREPAPEPKVITKVKYFKKPVPVPVVVHKTEKIPVPVKRTKYVKVPIPEPSPPHIVYHTKKIVSHAYDCDEGVHTWHDTWSHSKRLYCCWRRSIGCPHSHTIYHTHTVYHTKVVPKKVVMPPKIIYKDVTVHHTIDIDCNSGYSNWYYGWSNYKKHYCCSHEKRGCPGTWKGFAHGHIHVTVQKGVGTATGKIYDCQAGFNNWLHGWSDSKKKWCCGKEQKGCVKFHCDHDAVSTWGAEKRDWCCGNFQKGCAATTLSPLGCDTPCHHAGESSTCKDRRIEWASHHVFSGKGNACELAYSQIQVECDVCRSCTVQAAGCEVHAVAKDPYDCDAALNNFFRAWSPPKKQWCCNNRGKGCEGNSPPKVLSELVLTFFQVKASPVQSGVAAMARFSSRARGRMGTVALAAAAWCGTWCFVSAPEKAPHASLRPEIAAATAAAALMPSEAWAKGGQWGPLEGLIHPIIMPCIFFATLYTGFLGWQWRQTRTLGADLSALRKKLPKDEDPEKESSATKSLKEEISRLDAERKEMVQAGYKDKHHTLSSFILGGGIFFTCYGTFNTWFRAEKLFPGPHLFAGAAIVVLWAISAALVPFMEKGNDGARNAHIALNGVNVLLFAWQLPTGFEIAQKVWGLDIAWF
ncbi:unnamed protein product, partial [Durusdinium trenchii]